MNLSNIPDISRNHQSVVEAVTHAIKLLETKLSPHRYYVRFGSRIYQEMRRDMPYRIHKIAIQGTQILVNRNYKPLGSNLSTWGDGVVTYEDYKNHHVQLWVRWNLVGLTI